MVCTYDIFYDRWRSCTISYTFETLPDRIGGYRYISAITSCEKLNPNNPVVILRSRYINAWMLYTAPSIGTIAGWELTRIILRPLSALSLDNIVKRNITTGLFGLDEGLNALSGKNPSAAGWFSRPIKCPILAHISREANVSFRNSSCKAKNIYARADNNNPPGVAHNCNRFWRLFTMTITD